MSKNNAKNSRRGLKSPRTIGAIVVAASIVLIVVWLKVVRGGEDPMSSLATFVAKQGPLTISVLESGTIKSREQIIIKNECEGRSQIIRLVPEGSRVKKGDLLFELDASQTEDEKIEQEIRVQNTYAAFIDANETLAVVKNQAESDLELAKLTLEFAEQDLEQYNDGLYPNEVTAAEGRITLAEEELKRAQQTLEWSQRLYKEKYIPETELLADQLSKSRRDLDLTLSKNDLELLEEFTRKRNIAQLKSDVHQAEMALYRAQRKAIADVVQAEAGLKAKELEYASQKDKLQKLEDQLTKAKIYAPADGLVIYATSAQRGGPFRGRREPLEEGAEVHEREEIIYLPTADSAMAEVSVHESSLEKVQLGLPTIITVDALQGKKFLGRLARIAPLPDARSMWMNPDLKVYDTDIYLEDNDSALRTGMSCMAEIIIEQYKDAVYIPIQAVMRVRGEPTIHIVNEKAIEPRKVEIGLDNNRMVRIISGLQEGELVLLTPPLKSGTIESESEDIITEIPDTMVASDSVEERVSQRLEEINGADVNTRNIPSGDLADERPQRAGRREGPGGEGRGARQGQRNREESAELSSEQRERMRQRLQNMSPEERQRLQNMSPEERQRMRQQLQSTAPAGRARSGQQRQGSERNR
ncbi:MAG: efflux RND transporter periplasmic adaptor subunit [Planctomycetota bacterium]|jgi:HlyD family secretion protein